MLRGILGLSPLCIARNGIWNIVWGRGFAGALVRGLGRVVGSHFFILGAMVSAFYVDRRVKPFLCVGPWSEPLFAKRMATKVFGCQRPWPFIFG
jgi:hypothetical protein